LDVIARSVDENPNYPSNPAIAHTFLWILSQKLNVADLVIWMEFFLPCFSEMATSASASFQLLSLQYLDYFLEK
jgi:hypothetical protein